MQSSTPTYACLGVCARSGTPQPIVDLLNAKVVSIVNSPEYRSLVEQSGSVAISSTPQEFQKAINETVEEVAPIVQEFNLQLD
jgi:tripartite-type tricarboxylate transporter receptor subunit TctC